MEIKVNTKYSIGDIVKVKDEYSSAGFEVAEIIGIHITDKKGKVYKYFTRYYLEDKAYAYTSEDDIIEKIVDKSHD